MIRRLTSFSCLFLLSLIALVSGLSGCGGGGVIAVTIVKPSSTNVDPGGSVTLTVNVTNNSQGVTWSMTGSGCSGAGCGTLTDPANSSTATYTAPSTVATAFSVTITATSIHDKTKSASVTLNIPANPAITTESGALTAGQVGSTYAVTVAVSGGVSPYTWSVSQGNLPTGLTLGASTGTISGIPTASGTYNFTLKVTDSGSLTATAQFSIVVAAAPPIVFSTTSLASATYNVAYTATVSATGGAGALTYAVTTGSLPAGITMSSAGAITGTPTAAGTASFTVTASDAYGDSAQQALSIAVNYPAIVISPAAGALPGAQFKVAYSQSLTATGGSGSGYTWTVMSGGASLTAVNLSVSSSGAITGTPQAVGTATFTVKVTDSYGDTQTASYTIAVTYPALTVTTLAVPNGMIGINYGPVTLQASGGSGTGYSWSVTSGTALSATGLALSTSGVISGTPTTAESDASVTIQVEDSATNKATVTLVLTIYPGLSITSTTLPNATYGVAYTTNLAATGGDGSNLTWSTTSGTALTAIGLTLSSAGVLSGTPPSPANAPTPNCQSGKAYCLSISVSVANSDNSAFTTSASAALVIVYPTLTISTTTLPSGTVGTAYSQSLTASGGSGKGYTWSTTGTNTLSGIGLSFSGGTISGSSPTAGAGTFTAVVTDSLGNSAQATYTINIYSQLTITTTTLPSGDAQSAYSAHLQAGGGTGSGFTWSVTVGSLPAGLSLNQSTGAITGTPSSATNGGDNFTVQVKDSGGNTATQPLTLVIYLALQLPANQLQDGYVGVSYTGQISGSGGSGSLSISITSALAPANGTLAAAVSGTVINVTGTPQNATSESIGVSLTDTQTGNSISQTEGFTVNTYTAVSLPSGPQLSSLPTAYIGQSYAGAINASAGAPPYSWVIDNQTVCSSSGGSPYPVPNNLTATCNQGNSLTVTTVNGSSGQVSGPAGTITLTNVEVTDAAGHSAMQTYTITVASASPLSISNEGVPQGMVNMPYTFDTLQISGGVSPYTVTYSNVPAGLSQPSGSWQLVGTPTASGSTTVTVNVSDSTTPTPQQASATFTLSVVPETVAAKNGELKGQYACYYQQYWPAGVTGGSGSTLYRGGAVFAFTANGSGSITGGEIDINSPSSGYKNPATNGAISGTYAVGSDNRGYVIIGGSTVFAMAGGNLNSSSVFTEFALTGMDDVGTSPSNKTGGGHCYLQNTATSLSGVTLSGGYVFSWTGEDGQGDLQAAIGSAQFASGNLSGVMDMVDNGTYQADVSVVGTYTATADSYGRMTLTAGPSTSNENTSVIYITNNPAGEAVMMGTSPHNASSNAGFYIGEFRAQNATAIAASHPMSGPAVGYQSGPDSTGSASYDSEMFQVTGSSTEDSVTMNVNIDNDAGTVSMLCPGHSACPWTFDYTASSTTGRMTITGQSGVVFYVYNTGTAAFLSAGGGSTEVGWIEPQTAPASGTWAVGDFGTSYFMDSVPNGDYSKNLSSIAFTINSSGDFTYFAQDQGGEGWADWDEPCSGNNGQTGTCSLTPNTTLDPNSEYGIFDVTFTPTSGTPQLGVYCIAISVDKATDASAKARVVCLDATSQSPTLSIGQE